MSRLVAWIASAVLTVATGCGSENESGGAGGATVGDDGPVNAATTAATGATTSSTAAGNNGPCGGLVPLATSDQLAATPRDDADAEVLALEASGAFVAPEDLYLRVRDELEEIRALAPELRDISPRSELVPAIVALQVPEGLFLTAEEGSEHPAACAVALYGGEILAAKGAPVSSGMFDADFGDKVIDTVALADQLEHVGGVLDAYPTGHDADGPDVCLHAEGDAHVYIFDTAGGDCPAGCTEHLYTGFRVIPGAPPERLGDFDPYLDVDPTWFTSATRCEGRL